MGEPVIYIDPQRARDLDRDLTLQELYYRPEGYYRTAEKMQTACKRAGYGFTLAVIKNWLNNPYCPISPFNDENNAILN